MCDLCYTFTESGLSSGTSWTIDLNGNTISTTSSSISFSEPDGSYSYSIGSISGYGLSPSSGTANINGGSTTVSVTYSQELGYLSLFYNCNETDKGALIQHNLTQCIHNKHSSYGSNDNLMLEGSKTNISFAIPYFNAVQGDGSTGFRGIKVCTISSDGTPNVIYCSQSLIGTNTLKFIWTAQPGAYDGFFIKMENNNGIADLYYNHSFDVYSGLPNNNNMAPCLADSFNSIYKASNGKKIGFLTISITGGFNTPYTGSGKYYQLGLAFIPTTTNLNTYGIFNYEQSFNYTGSQYGFNNNATVITPQNSAAQASSISTGSSSSCCIVAEKTIYDLVEKGFYLAGSTCSISTILGLIMTAMGPFAFQQEKGGDSSYWVTHFDGNDYLFNNWIQKSGNNLPPQIKAMAYGSYDGPYGPNNACVPVYYVVNNGHGNRSLIQDLNIKAQLADVPGLNSNECALDYYTYSANATIVPISYCNDGRYFSQGDYVNATCFTSGWLGCQHTYKYTGPSYEVGTSLQLYFNVEG